jgi:hypothetical protein
MKDYVRSSPNLFRLIKGALLLSVLALLSLAALIPAPLESAADFSHVPNPAKSAWFLLWTQELVSYSVHLVYLILVLVVVFFALPWLPGVRSARRARWWPGDQVFLNWMTVVVYAGILVLTVLAIGFRGENWALVWPF